MRILLVCAGGMSTSMLMKKLQKYAADNGIALEEIIARGTGDYDEVYSRFDVILLGPQVSYQKDNIAKDTKKPIAVITPYDYAMGNAANIFKQVNSLTGR
ncbi:MAG: PTS sugar transporter subunit IIB [Clostridiales bacterium]|jgi:PTS system cellobiose-specific IIB component|nr:PTS sugar transporter subunit IIB [Clostridiales bacterium]